MAGNEKDAKPEIIHYLKNGKVRESMDGCQVPVNERTKAAYMLIATYRPQNKKEKDETV